MFNRVSQKDFFLSLASLAAHMGPNMHQEKKIAFDSFF